MDCCESAATAERRTPDAGDGVSDGDRSEATAIIERRITDAGDGVGNGDRGQTRKTVA